MAALVMSDGYVTDIHPKSKKFSASELTTVSKRWFTCIKVNNKVFVCNDDLDTMNAPINLIATKIAKRLGSTKMFRGNVLVCDKEDLML